jgi:hypothetical protein
MGTLHPLKGIGEAMEKSQAGPMLRIQKMNRSFHKALKLDELDFEQRATLSKCIGALILPETLSDDAVIAALVDPDRDFLEDFRMAEFAIRRRWFAFLTTFFMSEKERTREEDVMRRLGLILRVLTWKDPNKAD